MSLGQPHAHLQVGMHVFMVTTKAHSIVWIKLRIVNAKQVVQTKL